jgi:hypothetical protein
VPSEREEAVTLRTSTFVLAALTAASPALAQSTDPKPWGRIAFFTNSSRTAVTGVPARGFNELATSITYQFPELDSDGLEYGVDVRHSAYSAATRPDRVSVYEGFVGGRFADGMVRARVGHVWLNDLGALGAVAGGVVEVRQPRLLPSQGRVRAGVFGGLEPNTLDLGYAEHVKKGGAFVAYDADRGRRHVLGLVVVRNASLTERSVVTATNFVPIAQKVWIYQASEYDLRQPAGQAKSGLSYFFSNVRYAPATRVDVQGTYNRGRSIDIRSLSDDILNGRPLTQTAIDGLLYESIGGRVTVEVVRRVRVYGGYARDRNDRDSAPTGRTLVGGYAANVAGSGFDLAGSDNLIDRPTGSYHSRYVSVGRQIGRQVYTTVDYSTSLSVVRFSRSDGVTVELRPYTTRFSGTTNINLTRAIALLATLERTIDDDASEFRLLSGMTYRFQ